jgi:hypothetical protein
MKSSPNLSRGLVAVLLAALPTAVGAQQIQTERFDLPAFDLATVGNEVYLDFFFPPLPARIIETRFELTFETEMPGGFDAAKIGMMLQPPIDDPNSDDDRVLTLVRTGSDFGWSGTGTFTFTGKTNEANGQVLDAPPGAGALLYGVLLFNAGRLTDPDDASPIAGRFIASQIEVDYVAIPEPGSGLLMLLAWPACVIGRARRLPNR